MSTATKSFGVAPVTCSSSYAEGWIVEREAGDRTVDPIARRRTGPAALSSSSPKSVSVRGIAMSRVASRAWPRASRQARSEPQSSLPRRKTTSRHPGQNLRIVDIEQAAGSRPA